MSEHNIIVIDDEINICRSIALCLEPEGYHVFDYSTAQQAMKAMREQSFDAALIDIRLGQDSGIELFKQMLKEGIDIPAIFISGNASLDEAVQSVKLGAFDFIEKPFGADKLLISVANCIEVSSLRRKVKSLQQGQHQGDLIGEHPLMEKLRLNIQKVAQTDAAILISGESGTGKELIAQSIHTQSKRSGGEFVKVNCSAIPENLVDSALFGHVKGAFTGADQHKKGYFEMAHNGTLFLDEIGDMPLATQASLLRALENFEIQKVGSDKITKVNVRVLAASHKDLKQQVAKGNFREDLFYRLNVIPLNSPPLRERSEDIPLLVNHLLGQLCKRNGLAIKEIEPQCYPILRRYYWPGNVRELANTLERMLILSGQRIELDDIPFEIASAQHTLLLDDEEVSLKAFRQKMERQLLIQKLKQYQGNISQVARALQIDRTYLHKKLNDYEIKREQLIE